jgi:hypothetical protein
MAVFLNFDRFVLRAQASGAQVKVTGFAVDIYRDGVYIGDPAPVGMALGVADIVTEKRRFTA